ncbi:MAG: LysR family transcriptional regulator [Oligoflexia bacterium]|nr:LysR family transcriptional regulator [Oligoflexia bacterium]
MISPGEIQYFIESARTGNLSRAAERLGISQPALTMALRKLEHSVGCELFHRSKKGVRLTKQGTLFLQEAQGILENWERLTQSLRESDKNVKGTYSIGCHPSVALYSLPQTLPKLLTEHPELSFNLVHDLSRKIAEKVISGDLDIGIVVNPVRHPDLVIRPICQDQVRFWTSKSETKINRVASEKRVLLAQPELNQVQHLLRKSKISFSRIVTSSNLEVIASLANAGSGVAILPTRVAELWPNLKPLQEFPTFQDEVALLYREENRRSLAFKELVQRIEKGLI